jgi:phosphoribosylaminoimidazole-succinocarboxamide synthase
MFTLSGNQPVEQKTMKIPEKKGERLLDVEKQTTDELRDRLSGEKAKREFEEGRLKTSTGQRGGENETDTSKTTPKDTASPVESDRSLEILRREFERELGKSLDMVWATQVRVPNVLAEGVERISRVFGKEVVWLELADSTPFFNGVVSDQIPDKVFINAKTKEPYLFILGHEMLHQMKFQSPELYSSLLAETKKYMKDRKGIARLSELNREETYADLVGEAFTSEDYWNHLQKKNPTLFEKAIQIAKDIIDKAVKALGIRNVLSPQYFSDVKKAQTIIADIMDEYAQETGVNLSVGTLPKGQSLFSKDRQALVTDILNILSEGSTINFVGTIDPNRADIQKALTEWKKGNPDSAFTIEGMHRKVVVDGNKMASLIEIAMKGSSDIKLTAWHEAWHSIDELFLTAKEQKILAEKLTPDIEKQANIFAKYGANQKHLLPKSAKPIFERIREFFEKVGNYLKDRGFTSAEDVFNRALRGELKERAQEVDRGRRSGVADKRNAR